MGWGGVPAGVTAFLAFGNFRDSHPTRCRTNSTPKMPNTRATSSNPNPVTTKSAPAPPAPKKAGKRKAKAASGKGRRSKAPKVEDPAPEHLNQPTGEEVSAQPTGGRPDSMDAQPSAVHVPPTESTTSQLEAVKETANTALDQVTALAQQVDELKGQQATTAPTATRPKGQNQSNEVTVSPAAAEETKRAEAPGLSVQEQVHVEAWKNKHPESGLHILVSRLETLRTVGPRGLPTSRDQLLGFHEFGEMFEKLLANQPVPTSTRRKAQNCLTWYPKLFGNSTKRAINEAAYKLLLEAEWVTEITEVIDEIRKVIARLKAQESAVADAADKAEREAAEKAEREVAKAERLAARKAEREAAKAELASKVEPVTNSLRAICESMGKVLIPQLEAAFEATGEPGGVELIKQILERIMPELMRLAEVLRSAAEIYPDDKPDDTKPTPKAMTKVAKYQLWPTMLQKLIDLLETNLTKDQLEKLKRKRLQDFPPITLELPVKDQVTNLYTGVMFQNVAPFEFLFRLSDWAKSCNDSVEKLKATQQAKAAARKLAASANKAGDVPDNTSDEDDDGDNMPIGQLRVVKKVKKAKKAKSGASEAAPTQPQVVSTTPFPTISPEVASMVDAHLADGTLLTNLVSATDFLAAGQADLGLGPDALESAEQHGGAGCKRKAEEDTDQAGDVPPPSKKLTNRVRRVEQTRGGKSAVVMQQMTEEHRAANERGKAGSMWEQKMKDKAGANENDSDSDSDSDAPDGMEA